MRDYTRLEGTAFRRDRLTSLRVLVVGAGALGNEVIKNLALLGVGHIAVLDRDRIEASNLTRSVLFCTPDIDAHLAQATPKAVFASRRAAEINPDVRAAAHVGEIADLGAGTIRRMDLVFSCVDNEMARLELGWICTRLDKPLVDGGLGLINPSSGMVSLFPGREGPCYACRKGGQRRRELLQDLQGREDPCAVKDRLQRQAAIVPTTPTMSSVVGAVQVETGIRHVCAAGDDTARTIGVSYRFTLHPSVKVEPLTFERSPNCPLHQPESLIGEVIERADCVSDAWTPAELLASVADGTGFLTFDWPITARARCRTCGHEWEPMVRRARFRGQPCPACKGDDVAEIEVLTGVDAASPWATKPLAQLGLPRGHVHEVVVGSDPEGVRRHVEVTGDLKQAHEVAST